MTTTVNATTMMRSPPHPGEILRELYLAPMRVTIIEAAKAHSAFPASTCRGS